MNRITFILLSISITSAISGGALLYGMLFLQDDDVSSQRATIYTSSIAMIINSLVIAVCLFLWDNDIM